MEEEAARPEELTDGEEDEPEEQENQEDHDQEQQEPAGLQGQSGDEEAGEADSRWRCGRRKSRRSGAEPAVKACPRHRPQRRRAPLSRSRRAPGPRLLRACEGLLRDRLRPYGEACVRMLLELLIALTHRCGLAVERAALGALALTAALWGRVCDAPALVRDLQHLGARGRSGAGALLTAALDALGRAGAALRFGASLAGARGRRGWAALRCSWIWATLSRLSSRAQRCLRGPQRTGSRPQSPSREPGEELRRLLALAQVPEDELDPFSVLGVDAQASEAELKRAYRQLAVQVHPDKNKHPRAGEAFKVLRAAWDIVSNPETRREYEKRMAATELSKSVNDFLTKLQDDLKEAMNTMMCTKCEGKHRRFEMDRAPDAARFCGECRRWHSAEEGDLWAEARLMGLRITYFAFMDGRVFDITEWAGCQRISISPDTHRVPYHISFGSKGAGRQRAAPEQASSSSSSADLQDFFSRFFSSGSGEAPANGFFPSGAAPAGPAGFSSAAPRPENSEHWAEGRAPRRRRRARRPFQR